MRYGKVISSLVLSAILIAPFSAVKAEVIPQQITRSQVEQRALNMIDLKWNYNRNINGNIASNYAGYVTEPAQFKGIYSLEMTGIPYCWGGIDGIDTSSYDAYGTNFIDSISKGSYAGNVNTDSGFGHIPGTTGIDCSGFVQAAYNIKDYKLSTSTLFDKYFVKINLSDIKHMDILDRPGDHVVLFDRWGTFNGIDGAYTYESTPDQTYGGIQGTKKYFMPMSEINSGYIAGRYAAVVDDSSPAPDQKLAGNYAIVTNVVYSANFRSAPSTASSIICTIPKNTVIFLNSYSNGWYSVTYNGKQGYIYENLVARVPANTYVTVNNVYILNVRLVPSNSGQIIGTISQGQYAKVLGISSDGIWAKISINGITGWSAMKYLKYIQ